MIEKLIEIHLSLAKEAQNLKYRRSLYDKIQWEQRLIGIVGARGIGKTTLLLQYYLNHFDNPEDCLYISADHIQVANSGLYYLAEEFFKFGGEVLLIDEVHKYPNWQQELKNLYDSFPLKRVIFSGSSSIHLLKGKTDLSRRVVFYTLKGLSLREFLAFYGDQIFEPLEFADILKNHVQIAHRISARVPVLKYLKDYLKFGYYPFFKEGMDVFYLKLGNIIEKIFDEDIPFLFNVKPANVYNLKKLFYLVATSQPFVPNISRISSQLEISKEYIYTYISELEKAGLFISLHTNESGFRLLRKPQKIYLENVNLFSLTEQQKGFSTERGSVRETFFLNQVYDAVRLYASPQADFMDGQGRSFEIGGKNKSGGSNFIVVDDINVGFQNKIPLWLFGFLY